MRIMKHDVICDWLGLPATCWPPDHYSLLGLTPGESDVRRIEQHVHDRVVKVRCYQISHSEQATEAMNRLAQAFLCLTDATAKVTYDRGLSSGFPTPVPPSRDISLPVGKLEPALRKAHGTRPSSPKTPIPGSLKPPPITLADTSVNMETKVDWRLSPPPVRGSTTTAEAGGSEAGTAGADGASPGEKSEAVPTSLLAPMEPSGGPGELPVSARRGIGLPKALYERTLHLRQLLYAWERAGRYLNRPQRQLARRVEENDLSRHLNRVEELMEDFPPIVGQPGKPGYRVVAMARLGMAPQMLQNMDQGQRETLAKDWQASRYVLRSYRQFLLQEVKDVRRRTWFGKGLRAALAVVDEHPTLVIVAAALAGLGLAWLFFL
jgi:hypothetical protein